MESGKTEEQLLQELLLMGRVIGSLPYPVAIFGRQGTLRIANRILLERAELTDGDIERGKINLLDRVTDENYAVLEAAEDVFLGETTILENLTLPLQLFCRHDDRYLPDDYCSAVLFPLRDTTGPITHGVIMLMRGGVDEAGHNKE